MNHPSIPSKRRGACWLFHTPNPLLEDQDVALYAHTRGCCLVLCPLGGVLVTSSCPSRRVGIIFLEDHAHPSTRPTSWVFSSFFIVLRANTASEFLSLLRTREFHFSGL